MIDLEAIEARAKDAAGRGAEVRDIAESQRDVPAPVAEVRRLRGVVSDLATMADDAQREFLATLDAKHLGIVDRGDARVLRELGQHARRVRDEEALCPPTTSSNS